MSDDAAAMRKRMADYERERLRHNFPDIDSYHDELVLAIAQKMRTPQGAVSERQAWGEGVRHCLRCGRGLPLDLSWKRLCGECERELKPESGTFNIHSHQWTPDPADAVMLDLIDRAIRALRDVREALTASRPSETIQE